MYAINSEKRSAFKSLRAACLKNQLRTRSVGDIFVHGMSASVSFINSMILLFTPLMNGNSMCKYYGHVIDANWKGRLPCCSQCGAEVKDASMLRRAKLQV